MEDVADNEAREAPPSLGAILVRGREDQGLSRNDVAQRLHMSPSQVEALETGEYERLPRGPFLRGFVRNYAKLVGLDPDGVLSLLAEGAPREAAPRIIVPTQNIRFDPLGQRFSSPWVRAGVTAGVVIALGFAAMYWWLFVRTEPPAQRQASLASPAVTVPSTSQPESPASTPFAPDTPASGAAPSPSQPAPAPSPGAPVAGPSSPNAAAATASPARPPEAVPSKGAPASEAKPAASMPPKPADAQAPSGTAPAKPVAGARRLHFRFKGESWVEVRDASGHVVFRQLNPAGSEASVHAKPPLQVTVGNAHEVEMQKDGKPFDLAAPANDTDVARFKVE